MKNFEIMTRRYFDPVSAAAEDFKRLLGRGQEAERARPGEDLVVDAEA